MNDNFLASYGNKVGRSILDGVSDNFNNFISSIGNGIHKAYTNTWHTVTLYVIEGVLCIVILLTYYFAIRIMCAKNSEKAGEHVFKTSLSLFAYYVVRFVEMSLMKAWC